MPSVLPVRVSKRWQVDARIPAEIEEALKNYRPMLRQMLFNRGVVNAEQAEKFLNKSGSLHDPFLLTDMDSAVERLSWAAQHGETIIVYGDYDVDGITATVLMVQILEAIGAKARAYIPNRFDEGYGLTNEALEKLASEGAQLVLTVDCGIRSPREAERARELGIDLVISDHHEPRTEIPLAQAVICPKRPGDGYPEKNLAGVGLAYKIVEGLLARSGTEHIAAEEWLDLVAVGTVADVVPLTGENRSMVKAGLRRLRLGKRQGILSLANAADLALQNTNARDIGYVIGPRLNAAGRLDSAMDALSLLMSTEVAKTGLLAQKLDDQNRHRQDLTQKLFEEAQVGLVEKDEHLLFSTHSDEDRRKMGIVGLVASRLADTYYRPAVVAAQGEEFTRASCRSIPEFHITKALDECADLMERHGGHAMAAGFTIRNDRLPELKTRLKEIAGRELAGLDLRPMLHADMEIPLGMLRPDVLQDIDALEPSGLGNPGALFVSRGLRVDQYYRVGKDGSHLRLKFKDGGITFDAIAFRMGYWADQMPQRIDLLYSFEQNFYQGRSSLQLNIKDLKPADQKDEPG